MEKAVKKQKTLEVRRTKNMIKIMKKLLQKKSYCNFRSHKKYFLKTILVLHMEGRLMNCVQPIDNPRLAREIQKR